jgi:hypothetical protein
MTKSSMEQGWWHVFFFFGECFVTSERPLSSVFIVYKSSRHVPGGVLLLLLLVLGGYNRCNKEAVHERRACNKRWNLYNY